MTDGTSERRSHYRCQLPIHGSNPVVVTAGVLPRAALVSDLSPAGLGLVATFAPPVGAVLPVWLPGRPGEPSSLVLATVVHVAASPDGLHNIGMTCHDESSSAVLREFLNRLSTEAR